MSDIAAEITRTRTRLENYLAAEEAILTGAQSYRRAGDGAEVQVARAELGEIRATITRLEAQLSRLESSFDAGQYRSVIPVFGVIPPC